MRANPATLSACLIARDEEKNLKRCLDSVQSIVDEIVVVDTGSTDRTVEIAKECGAIVGSFDWCDDFAAARNAALDIATSKWVLSIDADEWLSPESQRLITEVKRDLGGSKTWRLYEVMIESRDANGDVQFWPTAPRLFPRAGTRWTGRLHEYATNSRFASGSEPNIHILHDGYAGEMAAKRARNLRILKKGLAEAMTDEEASHYLYYMCQSYGTKETGMSPDEVVAALEKCVDVGRPWVRANAGNLLSDWYIASHDTESVLKLMDRLGECRTTYTHCSLVAVLIKIGDENRARQEFARVVDDYNRQISMGVLASGGPEAARIQSLSQRLGSPR